MLLSSTLLLWPMRSSESERRVGAFSIPSSVLGDQNILNPRVVCACKQDPHATTTAATIKTREEEEERGERGDGGRGEQRGLRAYVDGRIAKQEKKEEGALSVCGWMLV